MNKAPYRRSRNANQSVASYADYSLTKQKEKLPVFQYRRHLLYLLEQYRTVIVTGETGCGKSTQIPQYLVSAGWPEKGKWCVGVTQPNPVAAVTLAERVSDEMGCILGVEVGFEIRFEKCTNPAEGLIKFMTDGILLHEIMKDPLLSKFCIIMLDEVHVRNINTDLCLALLKKIQVKRPDLRVIVSSATYNVKQVEQYFNQGLKEDKIAAVLHFPNKLVPPEIFYSALPVADYVQQTADTVLKIHFHEKTGDILSFLTGQEEVEEVVAILKNSMRSKSHDGKYLVILPLYASLPMSEQKKVFERSSRNSRKAIISTNVAENALTIPGIVYVTDCGFVKVKKFNPTTSTESIVTCPASKASLDQRAGRCGRLRPGKVYRLFEEKNMSMLSDSASPEIKRSNLVPIIIRLKALGVDNILSFKFLSPPPPYSVMQSVEYLFSMGALDDNGNLTTKYGKKMAELPLHPMFVKMLVDSEKFSCSEEIITVIAMMMVNVVSFQPNQRKSVRKMHSKFAVEQGDAITLLNVYNGFVTDGNMSKGWCNQFMFNHTRLQEAFKTRRKIESFLKQLNIPILSCSNEIENVQKCIASGLFRNTAQLQLDGSYQSLFTKQRLIAHPSSTVTLLKHLPKWVVYSELVETSHIFIKGLTVIQPEWLTEVAPHFFVSESKT
uniref:RNA helicase n=1 Tax=Phallusia mammillata TaxID=59560 RepID=A0A6F9DA98_9ASCI|nr:probable ATP-dependent RNA helicase DHX35 [Phallusia mammillata]